MHAQRGLITRCSREVGAIKRCECVPRILLKNGKRARNDLLKSQAKLREKRNGECQTTDVSKNVRNDALDEMADDDGKMSGGAGHSLVPRPHPLMRKARGLVTIE